MSPSATGAFSMVRFATADPDQGHDYLRRMVEADNLDLSVRGRQGQYHFSYDNLLVGNTVLGRLRHSMAVVMKAPSGVGWQPFYTSRRPTMEVDVHKRQYRLGAGQTLTIRPETSYCGAWDDLDADIVGLDQAILDDEAAAWLAPGESLLFDFETAVSPVAEVHWRRTVALTRQIGLVNATNPNGALLADQLGRLLASAALVCFPNPTLRDAMTPRAAGPTSLQRATAYIDAHLDQPTTLTDIAAAAGITARSLHETFRRHLDTTPMAYLRRGRLASAHHDLQAARPGDGQTVTSIAARWGFYSLPRFGVTYRQTYATTPSHTLRHT